MTFDLERKYFEKDTRTKLQLKYSFLGAFAFSMAANAFAYFNFYPQHDALNHTFYSSGAYEVSLGRFLLPLYDNLFKDGGITTPLIAGILSTIFIAVFAFLIAYIFNINHPVLIFLSAGFLSANATITELVDVFIFVEDPYILSLLFACLGVYFLVKQPDALSCLLGALCFFGSIGLYQAYCTVILLLFIFIVCKDAVFDHKFLKNNFKKYMLYSLSLLIGVVLYFIFYKLFLLIYNTAPIDSYNSLSSLSKLSLETLVTNIKTGYMNYFKFYYGNNHVMGTASKYCNIILTVISIILLLKHIIRKKLPVLNCIVLVICILISPVISLLMGICMGKNTIYFLTAYGLFLIYPVFISIIQNLGGKLLYIKETKRTSLLFIAILSVILFQNVIYSNGAHTYQKLAYDRALSNITRILDDIEETPQYVIHQTPVVLIGGISYPYSNINDLTTQYSELSGFIKTSITYTQTFGSAARLLGNELVIETDSEILNRYQDLEVVQNMPIYPTSGYCQMIDGFMVIKLSE